MFLAQQNKKTKRKSKKKSTVSSDFITRDSDRFLVDRKNPYIGRRQIVGINKFRD